MKYPLAGDLAAKTSSKLVSNPAWTTEVLADFYARIQEVAPADWLPRLTDPHARGGKLIAEMKEYGCGAYGCVVPTLDPSVVLKATTDKSEAEFAADLAEKLAAPICVRYFLVMKLDAEHRGHTVYLLWRQAADKVGKIDRYLAEAVNVQWDAAQKVLMGMKMGSNKLVDLAIDRWLATLEQMALEPELKELASGMAKVWGEQRVFFGDVHSGNLGLVAGKWIIIDPGNIVRMESAPIVNHLRTGRSGHASSRR